MSTAVAAKREKKKPWTQEKFNKAVAGHYYNKVGPKFGRLTITGADGRWEKNPQDIYIPNLRIAGHPNDITLSLRESGFSDSEIQKQIAGAYTAHNFESTTKSSFEKEKVAAASFRNNQPKKAHEFELSEIPSLLDGLKQSVEGVKSQRKAERPAAAPKPRKAKSSSREGLTVLQLRQLAHDRSVDIKGLQKRNDLIDALTKAGVSVDGPTVLTTRSSGNVR